MFTLQVFNSGIDGWVYEIRKAGSVVDGGTGYAREDAEARGREQLSRLEWESATVGARVDGRDVSIAELRESFDTHHKAGSWKDPVSAVVPLDSVPVFLAAVVFFQGDRPTTTHGPTSAVVKSRGYVC